DRGSCAWKFFLARGGYQRPDKIVFYPRTRRELARLVPAVRALMPPHGFHELRHAAPTHVFALERPEQAGVDMGLDPTFLRATGRLYRAVCTTWAARHRRHVSALAGGTDRWFARMNLSAAHEGPASLDPRASDLRYVRRYWNVITGF